MNEHIGDDAELYALGALGDAERSRIDGHLATCGECSRAVGEAERTTLAFDGLEWPATGTRTTANARVKRARNPLDTRFSKLVTAAALILFACTLELGIQNHKLAQNTHADDVALATLATSHFLHASFVPRIAGAAASKAIYARDGAWTYVIVDGDADGWHVYGKMGSESGEIATLHARGETSTAFAKPSRRYDSLELQNTTGQTVATVSLVYPKATP